MQIKAVLLDKTAQQLPFDFSGNSIFNEKSTAILALTSTSKLPWKVNTLYFPPLPFQLPQLPCSRQGNSRNSVTSLTPCLNESQDSGKILTQWLMQSIHF